MRPGRLLIVFPGVLFLLLSFSSGLTLAQEDSAGGRGDGPGARLTASVFRLAVKGLVMTMDLDKTKERLTKKIQAMSPEEFQSYFDDFYEHVRDCDVLKKEFGFSDQTTAAQALVQLQSLTKSQIYRTIDAIPDEKIVDEVKRLGRERFGRDADRAGEREDLWTRIRSIPGQIFHKYTGG